VLSQYMYAPKQSHMETAIKIVIYLKALPSLGLLMPSIETKHLQAFCDSDWGSCLQTRRSVTGYLVKFGEALVSWKSKKQETVARSSAEAEFRSMASCVAEVIWLVGLFRELGIELHQHVDLFYDSKAAIQIATNPIFHERTKHIDTDCHFVREKLSQGVITTHHLSTKDHLADLLTKSIGKTQPEVLLNQLGVENIFKVST